VTNRSRPEPAGDPARASHRNWDWTFTDVTVSTLVDHTVPVSVTTPTPWWVRWTAGCADG
jgi:hypothetical protein